MIKCENYYDVKFYDVDPIHVMRGISEYKEDECKLMTTRYMSSDYCKIVKIDGTYMYYEDGTKTFIKIVKRWDNNVEEWVNYEARNLGGGKIAKEI